MSRAFYLCVLDGDGINHNRRFDSSGDIGTRITHGEPTFSPVLLLQGRIKIQTSRRQFSHFGYIRAQESLTPLNATHP